MPQSREIVLLETAKQPFGPYDPLSITLIINQSIILQSTTFLISLPSCKWYRKVFDCNDLVNIVAGILNSIIQWNDRTWKGLLAQFNHTLKAFCMNHQREDITTNTPRNKDLLHICYYKIICKTSNHRITLHST